ncbi:uncharacterized protein SPSK_03758 [Sporothrix schenckii 1099-18]|uniref:SDR family NAD(P)-dependent oxidoreductase n=1 Tax=Sporothrix schenckii 1099-18 TaxID=1397361 RepID=A0A0F2M2Z0_SPOSC|nr:uncharacterized protein SPSK_03758 [Sporothrix schenckii 1099-18]KJR82501.1 hypothetical protein SPSK_03758 [Sporothrix schenckii 1099-18]
MPSSLALTSAGIVGASALAATTMGLFGGNQMPVDGKTVLITGASEGMGRSAARLLAAQGANVIVVARNVERLTETVAEIKVGPRG